MKERGLLVLIVLLLLFPQVLGGLTYPQEKVAYEFLKQCHDGGKPTPEIIDKRFGELDSCVARAGTGAVRGVEIQAFIPFANAFPPFYIIGAALGGGAGVGSCFAEDYDYLTSNPDKAIAVIYEKNHLSNSHLCFNNGAVSCLKLISGEHKLRYCNQDEIDILLKEVKEYEKNLPNGEPPLEATWGVSDFPPETPPNERSLLYFFDKGVSETYHKWKVSGIQKSQFREENKEIIGKKYDPANKALKSAYESFDTMGDRNILKVNDIPGQLPDPYAPYHKDESSALLVPCTPALSDYILDYRSAEQDVFGQVSHAYLCGYDNHEDNIAPQLEWLDLMSLDSQHSFRTKGFDKDNDGVLPGIDCNDNDPNVYGNFLKYSSVIPEIICNDHKANTCGIVSEDDDNNPNNGIQDSCDSNQYACTHNCLSADSSCDYQAGKCCGGNGLRDVGELTNHGQNEDANLCMNSKITGISCPVVEGSEESSTEKTWCWLAATKTDNQFKIFTIAKPGEDAFDIVSNGNSWQKCESEGTLTGTTEDADGNRFLCSQQGRAMAWSECCGSEDGACAKNPTQKRILGDGSYSFSFEGTVFDEQHLESFAQTSNPFVRAYKDLPDFKGYDFLEFVLKFPSAAEGPGSAPTPPQKQARLMMKVIAEGENLVYEGNVLGYTNNPTLEQGKNIHILIRLRDLPIQNWVNIKYLRFEMQPEATFTISHLQLSKSASKICTGKEWIDSADAADPLTTLSGEKVCTEYGGTWNAAGQTEQLCCGDDYQENWVDAANKVACINSQGLADKSAIGQVNFKVQYKKDTTMYQYDSKTIHAKLTIIPKDGKICPFSNCQIDLSAQDVSAANSAKLLSDSPVVLSAQDINSIRLELTNPLAADSGVYFQVYDKNYELQPNSEFGGNEFVNFDVEDSGLDGHITIIPLAEYNKVTPTTQSDQPQRQEEPFNFNCNQEVCSYPLKGDPPYTITNLEPQKYNLYYVYAHESTSGRSVLIDKPRTFYGKNGWLEAREVPQQIYFDNGLFGCEYEDGTRGIQKKTFCQHTIGSEDVPSGFFCNPQYSWKQEDLMKFRYDQQEDPIVLAELPGETIPSFNRTHARSIVPGRNLLYNPELES